jgi:hypothetical protein
VADGGENRSMLGGGGVCEQIYRYICVCPCLYRWYHADLVGSCLNGRLAALQFLGTEKHIQKDGTKVKRRKSESDNREMLI